MLFEKQSPDVRQRIIEDSNFHSRYSLSKSSSLAGPSSPFRARQLRPLHFLDLYRTRSAFGWLLTRLSIQLLLNWSVDFLPLPMPPTFAGINREGSLHGQEK